jgi:hypothetical protein
VALELNDSGSVLLQFYLKLVVKKLKVVQMQQLWALLCKDILLSLKLDFKVHIDLLLVPELWLDSHDLFKSVV